MFSSKNSSLAAIKAFTSELETTPPLTSETSETCKTSPENTLSNSFGGNGGFADGGDDEIENPLPELPAILRDLITETCKSTLVPPSLAIVPALGVLAGSLGGGVRIHRGGGKHTLPNLFLIAIAKSGTGKGQASNLIAKPLHAAIAERVELWNTQDLPQIKAELRITERRLKAAEKEGQENPTPENIRALAELESKKAELEKEVGRSPSFIVDNVTSEALALKLESQPGEAALAFSPEARGAASVMLGRYTGGQTDEALYLAAFSNEPYPYNRIGRPPVEIHQPSLSVTWMIQPDKAAELFDKADLTEGGLLPRFLITDTHAEPEDEPENPHTPDEAITTRWKALIELALDYREKAVSPITIETEAEAREIFRTYTNASKARAKSNGDLADLSSFPVRWGEQAWRLAVSLHVATHGEDFPSRPLTSETARQATALAHWFSQHQLSLMSRSRHERREKRWEKLRDILLKTEDGNETLRNLRERNGFSKEELERLTATFSDSFELKTITPAGGGRPSSLAILKNSTLS
ncbi:MAG: DUF3987 domain-containing protein [Akkermansiaceae bacterium]